MKSRIHLQICNLYITKILILYHNSALNKAWCKEQTFLATRGFWPCCVQPLLLQKYLIVYNDISTALWRFICLSKYIDYNYVWICEHSLTHFLFETYWIQDKEMRAFAGNTEFWRHLRHNGAIYVIIPDMEGLNAHHDINIYCLPEIVPDEQTD